MSDPFDLEGLFGSLGDLFGMSKGPARDVSVGLTISLLEAAHGATRKIEASCGTRCAMCEGAGHPPTAKASQCDACEGKGKRDEAHGALRLSRPCAACRGGGQRWDPVCSVCKGHGETRETRSFDVTIPPGVVGGTTLRLPAQGNDLGEGRGDVMVVIDVAPHASLTRDGDHLRARVRFDADRAARGGTLIVPWLEGTARVEMPAGTRAGDELRLSGWGAVRLGAPYAPPPSDGTPYRTAAAARGDLVVTLVDTQSLSDSYRMLGLHLGASRAEIDAAYRRLAMQLNPQRHPENAAAPSAFARLNAAYASITSVTSDEPERVPEPASPSAVPIVLGVLGVAASIAYYLLR